MKLLNFIKIMENMNTSIDSKINLGIINSKGFVSWFKQKIKALVEDQKIAKRDRKDEKHPCPENRKYYPGKASQIVRENKETLRSWYVIYYNLKHNRDFGWEEFEIEENTERWAFLNSWRIVKGDCKTFNALFKEGVKQIDPKFDTYGLEKTIAGLVKKYYAEEVKEEALCPCR